MKAVTLIVSDIFGLTPSLQVLCDKLSMSQQVIILDPYQGQTQQFNDEANAYQTFIDKCGHDNYFAQTCQTLKNNQSKTRPIDNIIAFSAGASAAYRAVSQLAEKSAVSQLGVKHFIGFYPSQIRHHLDLKPQCPTTLIFPAQEPHFDVAKVIKTVAECSQEHQTVTCLQSSQNHGFMNPLSAGFSHQHAAAFEQVFCQHPLSDYQLIAHQCREICQHEQQHHRSNISRL